MGPKICAQTQTCVLPGTLKARNRTHVELRNVGHKLNWETDLITQISQVTAVNK